MKLPIFLTTNEMKTFCSRWIWSSSGSLGAILLSDFLCWIVWCAIIVTAIVLFIPYLLLVLLVVTEKKGLITIYFQKFQNNCSVHNSKETSVPLKCPTRSESEGLQPGETYQQQGNQVTRVMWLPGDHKGGEDEFLSFMVSCDWADQLKTSDQVSSHVRKG